jgi:hypothetical protein
MNSDEDKELKQLWTKYSKAASQSRLDQKEIAAMVEEVIERPLRKMRIGLFWEKICTVLICIWLVYFGLHNWGDWTVILSWVVLMGGCIYALYVRVQTLRKLQQGSNQPPEMILQTLRKSIEKMDCENRKYVRVLLAVVYCLCAAILSKIFFGQYFSHNPYFGALKASNSPIFWAILFTICTATSSAAVYAIWYRQHFYREPMERMQTAIREIEQEN